MSSIAWFRVFSITPFSCIVAATFAISAQSQAPTQLPKSDAELQAQLDLGQIIAGLLSDTSSHMRMAPTRMATMADSARAAAFVVAARAALGQYVDVNVAERDGYYRNLSMLDNQPIYHYNNMRNFRAAAQGEFDATKPVSLLYKKNGKGEFKLVGAMYASGGSAAPADLDALLPTSMAHWHEHVNLCYPGGRDARLLSQRHKIDALTVLVLEDFLSRSSRSECENIDGQFVPLDGSGWMTHVYLFAGSDDPKVIWDLDDMGNSEEHTRHPQTDSRG